MAPSRWHSLVLWIIRLALVVAALWVYQSARDAFKSPPALDGTGGLSDQFVSLLLRLQKIDLRNEVLTLPMFRAFKDFSVELAGGTPGRPNPFSPVGSSGSAAKPAGGASGAPAPLATNRPANPAAPAAPTPPPTPPTPTPPPNPNVVNYTITASAGAGGSIAPSGAVTVPSGSGHTFTITPNSGYQLATLKIDGVDQPLVASYSFGNLNANHTISVSFSATTPTPPPTPPASSGGREIMFNAYVNDGHQLEANDICSGPLSGCRRRWLMAILPALKTFGFNKIGVVGYPAMASPGAQAEATQYYQEIQAGGFNVVPGFYLAMVFYAVPGMEEGFGINGCGYNCHSQNPSGLASPAFWNKLEEYTARLASMVSSREVSLDTEDVFLVHQNDAFWTAENLATVRQNFKTFSRHMAAQGITVDWYHPEINPSYPQLYRIATTLFDQLDADSDFRTTRILGTLTYPDPTKTSWHTLSCTEVESARAAIGNSDAGMAGNLHRVSHGYIYRTNDPSSGWSMAAWRSYLVNNPSCRSVWMFTGDQNITPFGADVSQTPPLP
jgi:hypothetical protein